MRTSLGETLGASFEVRARTVAVTESPIEAAMLTGLLQGAVYTESSLSLSGRGIARGTYHGFFAERDGVTALIVPQLRIHCRERYRLDFGVILERGGRRVCAALECDGIEFHSASEDVKRDKMRDRDLAAAGWLVLRFPGQEIVNGVSTASSLAWKTLVELAAMWCREDSGVLVGLPTDTPAATS